MGVKISNYEINFGETTKQDCVTVVYNKYSLYSL